MSWAARNIHRVAKVMLQLETTYLQNLTLLSVKGAGEWLRVRPLRADDFLLIGSIAFQLSEYEVALRWLKMADDMSSSAPAQKETVPAGK